ncbi:MAG: hypothetical protein GY699_07290, partial [Desulfobacteraceae bacterium]|nr:hypothetical protein [Desulfobacteraceae bacterium]
TYDLIGLCDLCTLAQPSTTGLEALALDKPLVQLDVEINTEVPYSFTEQNVAIKMTSSELALALSEKKDFSTFIDHEVLQNYLEAELTDPDGATDRIIHIAEKLIEANNFTCPAPIIPTDVNHNKEKVLEWSILIPVPSELEDEFLFQLESLSVNSKNSGEYEVILLKPDKSSKKICEILESLKGNIQIIDNKTKSNRPEMMNMACKRAKGKNLLFMSGLLAPCENWLVALKQAFEKYGDKKIFGAKITNKQNNIVHAGMIINENSAPVSAYLHLGHDFPFANKERPFQMFDYFIALKNDYFFELGGLWAKSGKNAFMDISLRAQENTPDSNAAIYLPELHLIQLDNKNNKIIFDDSIYFYGRWHGTLWESSEKLYNDDGISKTELDAARLISAMKTTMQ